MAAAYVAPDAVEGGRAGDHRQPWAGLRLSRPDARPVERRDLHARRRGCRDAGRRRGQRRAAAWRATTSSCAPSGGSSTRWGRPCRPGCASTARSPCRSPRVSGRAPRRSCPVFWAPTPPRPAGERRHHSGARHRARRPPRQRGGGARRRPGGGRERRGGPADRAHRGRGRSRWRSRCPRSSTSTSAARAELPTYVALADAVYNMGRAALVVEALRRGDLELLGKAMDDRLHQALRLEHMPGGMAAMAAAREAGAAAVAVSGSGPSLIAFPAPGAAVHDVAAAMVDALARVGVSARPFTLATTDRAAEVSSWSLAAGSGAGAAAAGFEIDLRVETDRIVLRRFTVYGLTRRDVSAHAQGEPLDPGRHQPEVRREGGDLSRPLGAPARGTLGRRTSSSTCRGRWGHGRADGQTSSIQRLDEYASFERATSGSAWSCSTTLPTTSSKREAHTVDGAERTVWVHRKGVVRHRGASELEGRGILVPPPRRACSPKRRLRLQGRARVVAWSRRSACRARGAAQALGVLKGRRPARRRRRPA